MLNFIVGVKVGSWMLRPLHPIQLNLAPLLGSCFETPFNTNAEFRDRNRLHLLMSVTGAAGWQLFARY